MDRQRLDRVCAAMTARGLDALFVSNLKNVKYLTGFVATMPMEVQPLGDPEAMVLVYRGEVHVLCDGRYIAGARQLAGVTAHQIESPSGPKVFGDAVRRILGSSARTIGIEADALLHSDAVGLLAALSPIQCTPAEDILAEIRVIKSREEVEWIRRAQAITSQCFEHIRTRLRPGVSERQIALEIETYLRTNSEGNSFSPIVSFGETCCHPHYSPDPERLLEKGHMVLLDFGAIHRGYCGDMTRMVYFGKADARYREVYGWVLEAQRRSLAAVRPGVTCESIDMAGRSYFESHGCAEAFKHGTGHGVGLAIHEAPRIKKSFTNRVAAGMVFSIEPGLYFEEWGGVRIEDLVAVTPEGCENLTTTCKELIEQSA